jgi:hypothetical protein
MKIVPLALLILSLCPVGLALTPGNILYAENFTSVQATINSCQSITAQSPVSGGTKGCIVYATANTVNLALGTLDPGANTIPITLILGPFDFTATQIVMRADFRIFGSGSNHTSITSSDASKNLIVFPQLNNTAITGVALKDIHFIGAAGNTSQEGLSIDVSNLTTSQFSYTKDIENLTFTNFHGFTIHFKGRANDANSAIQRLTLTNVWATRPAGGGETLRMEGYNGQITFESCEFDGSAPNDGEIDIYIGPNGSTGTYVPITIFFHNLTVQNGTYGMWFGGAQDIIVDGAHSEATPWVFAVSADSSTLAGASNRNIVITHSYIAGSSASTLLLDNEDPNASIRFLDNLVFGTPGVFRTGTYYANIKYCGNSGTGVGGCVL